MNTAVARQAPAGGDRAPLRIVDSNCAFLLDATGSSCHNRRGATRTWLTVLRGSQLPTRVHSSSVHASGPALTPGLRRVYSLSGDARPARDRWARRTAVI